MYSVKLFSHVATCQKMFGNSKFMLINFLIKGKPRMMVNDCSPSYLGVWDKKIAWACKFQSSIEPVIKNKKRKKEGKKERRERGREEGREKIYFGFKVSSL
jgi:hypothetical protein